MADPLRAIYPEVTPRNDDPGWQPSRDPLAGQKKAPPGIIVRDQPQSFIHTQWSWYEVRAALRDLTIGQFDRPSQLIESIFWDARVQASMGSRTGGLLGREPKFEAASNSRVKGSRAAKEALDGWMDAWPKIAAEDAFAHMHSWGVMAFGLAQLIWDTDVTPWVPHITPFNIRHTYYQTSFRKLVAMTLDGQIPVTHGDGLWVVNAPYGGHFGWMRGALPALAQPWIQRNFAYRDLARFCERHGFPIIQIFTPALADPEQLAKLKTAFVNIGQESILEMPQGVGPEHSYKADYLEAKSTTHEVFGNAIDLSNGDISLALLWQNLTTEIKEGSHAAARMHGDVRQSAIEFDNRGESRWVHSGVARPFAYYNYGDADLAPWTSRDVEPYEDHQALAATFASFANAVIALRGGGLKLKDRNYDRLARRMGLRDLEFEEIDPIQVESAKASGKSKKAESKSKLRRAR